MRISLPYSLARAVLFLCLVLPTASGRAQISNPAPAYVLSVSTDRTNAMYHRGERVTYAIKLLHDQKPAGSAEVSWTISKDGVPPVERGKVTLTNGAAVVSGELDEPGFLQCVATFHPADEKPGDKPIMGIGGAAVDPLGIKPSLPVPDDFDAFWAAQKKKLAAVPINARLTPVESKKKALCFDVKADSIGAPISGYFGKPVGAKPKSLPIMLTVHGAGVSSSSLGGTASWANRGFLAFDLNAHGIPNGQSDAYYSNLFAGDLKNYYLRGRESRDTIYFLGMCYRLVRAIDFLTSQPEWDGRTVIVHGSSQGGAQSLIAAGLDERVTFFAAGVPAMCDHTGGSVGRISGWPKLVPKGKDGKPDPEITQVARYFDAMNFATRTRAAGIVTVGFIDQVCPPTSIYAAYNALKGPKEIFNDPPSPHHVGEEASAAMRRAIEKHVKEMKKKD